VQLCHVEADDAVLGQHVAYRLRVGALRRQNVAERRFLRPPQVGELFRTARALRRRFRHGVDELGKRHPRIGDDVHVRRPRRDRLRGIDIDANELHRIVASPLYDRVEQPGADREHHVDLRPHVVARLQRLRQRMADVDRAHAVLAHHHRRLENLRQLLQRLFCAEHTTADEDRRALRRVEQRRGALDRLPFGSHRRGRRRRRQRHRRCGALGGDIGRDLHRDRPPPAAVELPEGLVDHRSGFRDGADVALPLRH
jgi:hypothetical protein